MNWTISSHTGPAETTTRPNTATNNAANTTTAARPRPHPRRTSAPTTGSRPSATTAARKIDSSVPSDTTARTTSAPKTSSCRSVRTGTAISTRCAPSTCGGSGVDDRSTSATVMGAGSPPPSAGRTPRGREGLLEARLGLVVERRLDDLARDLDLPEHLVRELAAHERDDRRSAGRQLLAELLHELVVHARVRRRTAGCARCGPDGHAEQRHQEDQADQAAPQRAAGRPGARERGLMQLDLAVAAPLDDDEVVDLDVVAGLCAAEVRDDLLGRADVLVGDRNEMTHGAPFDCCRPIVRRAPVAVVTQSG